VRSGGPSPILVACRWVLPPTFTYPPREPAAGSRVPLTGHPPPLYLHPLSTTPYSPSPYLSFTPLQPIPVTFLIFSGPSFSLLSVTTFRQSPRPAVGPILRYFQGTSGRPLLLPPGVRCCPAARGPVTPPPPFHHQINSPPKTKHFPKNTTNPITSPRLPESYLDFYRRPTRPALYTDRLCEIETPNRTISLLSVRGESYVGPSLVSERFFALFFNGDLRCSRQDPPLHNWQSFCPQRPFGSPTKHLPITPHTDR